MEGSALRNTQGKFHPTQLIYVTADKSICFGMIGTKRFCRSNNCKTKANGKKFLMGTKEGWFISGKSNLSGQPNLFVRLFLDALKITEDRAWMLKNLVKRQTMDQWEEYVSKAQEEWEEVQACILYNIQEGSLADNNVDDDDSDAQLIEGGNLCLTNPPETFTWAKDLEGFEAVLKGTLEELYCKDSTEAVEALQATMCNLEGMVVEMRQGLRNNALEVLTQVNYSIAEIVAAIDRINKRGWRWASDLGDVGVLREDSGFHGITVVDALLKLLEKGAPQDSSGEDVSGGLEALSGMVVAIGNNLSKNCRLLNNKIKALEGMVASMPRSPPHALPALTMSTPIFDDNGNCVITLGGILQENLDLKRDNEHLQGVLEKLAADITAQGSVVVGKYTFTSEVKLNKLCVKECPKGDAFAAFVDPMTIFCFDPSYVPIAGWETFTKAMEKSGNYPVTDRKVVASFNAHHSHWFLEGKTVVAGKTL
jgi:hypothetical protein